MTILSPARLAARQASSHPEKPKGCNGWWHPTERALMHGAAFCPVHDADDTVKGS